MNWRFGIQKKAVSGISLLLMLLAISLMSVSLYNDTRAIRDELLKRGRVTTDNLAYNATYATLLRDTTSLADFLDGVMAEREVLFTAIMDADAVVLAARSRDDVAPALDIPISESAPSEKNDTGHKEKSHEPSAFCHEEDDVVHFCVPITMVSSEEEQTGEFGLYGVVDKATPGAATESEQTLGYAHVGMTTHYIEETIADLRNKMIWITAFAILMAMIVTSFMVRWSISPINELVLATGRVANGDYTVKVAAGRNDEIGDLASSFNKMTEDLKSSRDALVEKELLEQLVVELRETQEQLVQAGKLAAVGQLAAGVAHEINNPLAGIMGYAQLLTEKMRRKQSSGLTPDEVPRYLSYVENMEKQSQRCKQIVQNLLKFARASSKEELALVDCNKVLEETAALVAHQMETNGIDLILDPAPDLPSVLGHEGKLQQVFTNILINGMQATSKGGSIRASTLVSNNQVLIRIQDSGIGIGEEDLGKIFEPFFTTKEIGQGTGLGLSVSYGLVRDLGGDIAVESELGVGSTFTVSFPIARDTAEDDVPTQPDALRTSGVMPPKNSSQDG